RFCFHARLHLLGHESLRTVCAADPMVSVLLECIRSDSRRYCTAVYSSRHRHRRARALAKGAVSVKCEVGGRGNGEPDRVYGSGWLSLLCRACSQRGFNAAQKKRKKGGTVQKGFKKIRDAASAQNYSGGSCSRPRARAGHTHCDRLLPPRQ